MTEKWEREQLGLFHLMTTLNLCSLIEIKNSRGSNVNDCVVFVCIKNKTNKTPKQIKTTYLVLFPQQIVTLVIYWFSDKMYAIICYPEVQISKPEENT